jgi:hypothetical protein
MAYLPPQHIAVDSQTDAVSKAQSGRWGRTCAECARNAVTAPTYSPGSNRYPTQGSVRM